MIPAAESDDVRTGSFRDPSGQVFGKDGRLFRRINASYAPEYERLTSSGLYRDLTDRGLLVPHTELPDQAARAIDAFKVIEPERIPFVSYPFEWCFGQLKAAALITLEIQRLAVEHQMTLKDASAYNIQFRGADPVLIDTLSFEAWDEGAPWVGYRQFCQHFLGPLALMSRTDVRLGSLARIFIDGVPLDLAAALLPASSRLSPSLLVHVHVHARAQSRHATGALDTRGRRAFSRRSMLGLVDHLRSAIDGLKCRPGDRHWVEYYANTNYSADAMAAKQRVIAALVERERPATVWDLGANTGAFSRLAAERGGYTVAFDGDGPAVERHYQDCRARGERGVLPLVMDLANPTGPMGWNHDERLSLRERGPADLVLALGLIHHLSLSNQVPMAMAARFFQGIARTLAIEFVPRTDSQVRSMLSRMPRLDEGYTLEAFEREFERCFSILHVEPIAGSQRRVYLMRRKATAA